MTKEAIAYIHDQLISEDINYEFGEWKSHITYPYFVGEYNESEPTSEDGLQEAYFILNGFNRGTLLELENVKETIIRLFNDNATILSNGSGLDVSYAGSLIVPTGDASLKRIQINLKIKEWRL